MIEESDQNSTEKAEFPGTEGTPGMRFRLAPKPELPGGGRKEVLVAAVEMPEATHVWELEGGTVASELNALTNSQDRPSICIATSSTQQASTPPVPRNPPSASRVPAASDLYSSLQSVPEEIYFEYKARRLQER